MTTRNVKPSVAESFRQLHIAQGRDYVERTLAGSLAYLVASHTPVRFAGGITQHCYTFTDGSHLTWTLGADIDRMAIVV